MTEPVISVGVLLADDITVVENPPRRTFTVKDVPIGVDFHWQRTEDQEFLGSYKIVPEAGRKRLINSLPLEDYLACVISSEMAATNSLELLKAHAVISRSWLMAQLEKSESVRDSDYSSLSETEEEYIRWYDREDHKNFDVCADDHCQRYQGVTRILSPLVEQAVRETYGEFLIYNGSVCDARFSKCCGGVTETFENTWEADRRHLYITSVEDKDAKNACFCNTKDKDIIAQVLNDYDQETADFFEWEVRYSQAELSALLQERTGWDFGEIIDLVPIERGVSGRIIRLKIVGAKLTKIIGKELFIRKSLSKSHLYSSNFEVERVPGDSDQSFPSEFILKGKGWGHGVGLCQIGAAVMAVEGYNYKDILKHYFPKANVKRLYEGK